MKKPNKVLPALGVGRMVVRYYAHGLTLFAAVWCLPSGVSLLLFYDFLQRGSSVWALCGALVLPAIHLWSIVAAIYYWRTERKRKVTVLHTGGEFGDGV